MSALPLASACVKILTRFWFSIWFNHSYASISPIPQLQNQQVMKS